jgi:hypothetical protein
MNRPSRHFVRCLCRAIFVVSLALGLSSSSLRAIAEPPPPIDDAKLQSAGIRKLVSKHLILYTDAPASAAVDRLPAEFDQAVPQWAAYFNIDPAKTESWQPRAFLVSDPKKFAALGLMPRGYEQFENGITVDSQMWLKDQPTDYYRRHLLLHEGTHAFMIEYLGGCGPGWYMEGTAELLGTHHIDAKTGKLTLGIMPQNREEVPMLGRVKLIEDARANHRVLTFQEVMELDNRRQLGNEAYAWCWAAAKFLDSHPRYRDRFRQLYTLVLNDKFNDVVRQRFANDWADLNAEWLAFIATLDFGFNFERMAIKFEPGEPLADVTHFESISADRGWQSTRAYLEAGKSYEITAWKQFQIAEDHQGGATKPWLCEPGGVTIDYHDGRPLGILLGAIDTREEGKQGKPAGASNPTFTDPTAIGLRTILKPTANGTLYLRVNDSAAQLDDNNGTLRIKIQPVR